jgi:hypothetical protein
VLRRTAKALAAAVSPANLQSWRRASALPSVPLVRQHLAVFRLQRVRPDERDLVSSRVGAQHPRDLGEADMSAGGEGRAVASALSGRLGVSGVADRRLRLAAGNGLRSI